MPKHQQGELLLQARQEQQPIDCFEQVQVPMPIDRLHQREQVPEGECCYIVVHE